MSDAQPPRGPPPRGPPPGNPSGYPQARGPPPGASVPRGPAPPGGPPPGAPPGRGPPPGGPPGAPPGRGPPPGGPPGAPPGRGPPPGAPPGRGLPPGAPPGRGPPPGAPPGRGPPPGGPPGAPPGRGPPPGAPPGRGPPPGAPPGLVSPGAMPRGLPPGMSPPSGAPPGMSPGGPPGGPPRGPPPGAPSGFRGPPPPGQPGGPPPGMAPRGPPPGMIPPGMPPRGPPGAPPGIASPGMPPRGVPPGAPPGMPPGMPPRGPPSGALPAGMPGRGLPPGMTPPGMPPRGPPGMAPPGMPPRGPPGMAPPGMAPPGMPPRGPPGMAPPGMPPRGPPGMPPRGPPGAPPGMPPRGPPGLPPRGPPGQMPSPSIQDAMPSAGAGSPRGPPGMPPRGPPGMPPGMPPRGPPGGPPRGPPGPPPTSGAVPTSSGAFGRFGKLSVKVVRALDLKKLGMMDTADPYVKLTIGAQNFQTKVHDKGGKNPEFNETFEFNISTEKELVVDVFDQETGGKDRFMAQAKVDIVPWLAKGGFEGDVDLRDAEGQAGGRLSVVCKFVKPAAAPPGGPVKAPPMAPPVLSGPAVAPLPPGAHAVAGHGGVPLAPSEPPRDPNGKFTDKEILEAFQAFDLDHNNYVGAAEIRHVLINIGESPTDEEVDEMIKMVDKDGDGQVSFDEFYAMVTKGKQPPPGLGVSAVASPDKAGGNTAAASGAQAIQLRNQRKNALEEFARDNGIKPESVKKAYKRFQATDKDGSGQIDYSEFCEVMQVDPSPQCEKTFQLFDNDRTGRIDVREFMIALSNFSGAEKDEKLKFAFMVFDEDGNGVITRQELLKILKANHMASSESEVARKADTIMSQGDKDGDGVISFDEFAVVSKRFPNILFPAYTLSTTKD